MCGKCALYLRLSRDDGGMRESESIANQRDFLTGYAAEHGFSVLTTTLASSRWKSLDQINEAGRWAVAQVNAQTGSAVPPTVDLMRIQTRPDALSNAAPLIWWEQNWRKGGLQERRSQLIREHNFYNQLWCGCEFSRR